MKFKKGTKIKWRGDWYKFEKLKADDFDYVHIVDKYGTNVCVNIDEIEDIKKPFSLKIQPKTIMLTLSVIAAALVMLTSYNLVKNNPLQENTTEQKVEKGIEYKTHVFKYEITYTDNTKEYISEHNLVAPKGVHVDLRVCVVDGLPCLGVFTDGHFNKIIYANVKHVSFK